MRVPTGAQVLAPPLAACLLLSAGLLRAEGEHEPEAPSAPAGSAAAARDSAPRDTAPGAEAGTASKPDSAPSGALPPGHPSMAPPQGSQVLSAPDLPHTSVEVRLVDPAGAPVEGSVVTLSVAHQDVEQGDSTENRTAPTDARGVARFDELPRGATYSFRASVQSGAARYASASFPMRGRGGQRVALTVYPVTRDVREAMVGARAMLFVQPRDDVFQLELSYQIFNVGRVTWVPEAVELGMPTGWKGFDESSDTERGFHRRGDKVLLEGSFHPGQHEVIARFQVPNDHVGSQRFALRNLPHVVEMRVVAEASRDMRLKVDGFDPARALRGSSGERLVGTLRKVVPGQAALDTVTIELAGLPVPSRGRWVAALLAALLALIGLLQIRRQPGAAGRAGAAEGDLEQAREILLTELVLLERAHQQEQIGPSTYEQTRSRLLDALARLEGPARAQSAS